MHAKCVDPGCAVTVCLRMRDKHRTEYVETLRFTERSLARVTQRFTAPFAQTRLVVIPERPMKTPTA